MKAILYTGICISVLCFGAAASQSFAVSMCSVTDVSALVAPSGLVTLADINEAGEIVGSVTSPAGTRGFILSGNQATLLLPLASSDFAYSEATAIN